MDEYNKDDDFRSSSASQKNDDNKGSEFDSKNDSNNDRHYQPYSGYKSEFQSSQTNSQEVKIDSKMERSDNLSDSSSAKKDSSSVSQNQSRVAGKFMPTNLPPASANTSSGELNSEEMEYLGKISDQNFFIKKRSKKSKGKPFNEPRALSRVRRLYPMSLSRRYYGFPPKQVKKLRDRMGDDKGKIFGAAARRAKNLIISLVLVVAIIATLGTGVVVTMLALNTNNNVEVNTDGLVIVNADQITPISGYSLGMWQENDFYIKMQNKTNTTIHNVRFYIMLSPTKDSTDANSVAFSNALANGTIDPTQLIINYQISDKSKNLWQLVSKDVVYDATTQTIKGPILRYNGGVVDADGQIESSVDTESIIDIISNFSIDIKSPTESNKWANLSMTISFVVEADEVEESKS